MFENRDCDLSVGTYFYMTVLRRAGCALSGAPSVVLCQILGGELGRPVIAFYFNDDFVVSCLDDLESYLLFEGIYGKFDTFANVDVLKIARDDYDSSRVELGSDTYCYSFQGMAFFGNFPTPEVCIQSLKDTFVGDVESDTVFVGALAPDSETLEPFNRLGYFRGQLSYVMKMSLSSYKRVD